MKELIKNIESWAEERYLIKGSTPIKQFKKLMEEVGELCGAEAKGNIKLAIDGIGDCAVVMIVMCKQLKIDNIYIINAIQEAQKYNGTENNDFIFLRLSGVIGKLGTNLMFKIFDDVVNRDMISNIYQIIYFLSKLSDNLNITIGDCLNQAYNEIKDRKGMMINGVFVKEEDL